MFVVRGLFGLIALAVAVLCSSTPCSLPTQINGYGRYPRVCVDDEVTITCAASSNATTVLGWKSDVFGSVGPAYFSIPTDTASKARGSYNLSFVNTTAQVLVSRAVTTALLSLNATTISCLETRDGAQYSEISTGCFSFADPPSDPLASLVRCTTDSVTLQWNGSLFDGGSNLTTYTLTSNPPASNCNGSCAVDSATLQYTFTGLQFGVPYTLSVRATNCGGKQQGVQSDMNVTIPIPLPLNISVCSIYDATTNQIIQLSTTWSPLPGARLNDRLQCNRLGHYTVTYLGLSGVDRQNMTVPTSSCNPNCSSLINVEDTNSTFYNVSVAEIGIPSAFQTIASTNNVLKVEVVNWTQSVAINCTFLSGLVGTSGCVVSFGTSPDNLPYTLTSSQSGGSGQSVSVPLAINGSPLDLRTSYFYTASLLPANSTNQCVTIRGSLCGLRYLGALLTKDCLCPEGQFGMGIMNGCICYNGIIPGSQANVQCNVGYQLLGNSTQLLCQGNGLWSDMQPRCEKRATSQVSNDSERAGAIAGAVVGSVFAILCLLALMCFIAKMKHVSDTKKAKTSKAAADHNGIEASTELSSSISYPLDKMPYPPPLKNATNNEKEWAAIMNVVQDAASPTWKDQSKCISTNAS